MSWTYSPEYYKEYTRTTWNESAPHYDPIERQLDQYNAALLRHAAPRPGERVLDVATGAGQPALSLAPLVGGRGRVVGIDLSEAMVERARERARRERVENVSFEVMDAERLSLADESVDLVTSRFGLQIVTDPDAMLAEARRVLRPGGRVALTVWASGERCPIMHTIIGPMLEEAEPDETGYLPTPYEMGGAGELVALLHKQGFRGASEERVTRDWRFESLDVALDAMLKGSPLGHSLGEEDADVQKRVLAKTRVNLRRFIQEDGCVQGPAEAVVVNAVK